MTVMWQGGPLLIAPSGGGYKESGVSRRHGAEGLYKYTEPKTIAQQRGFPIWGPQWLSQKSWSKVLWRSLSLGKKTGLLR